MSEPPKPDRAGSSSEPNDGGQKPSRRRRFRGKKGKANESNTPAPQVNREKFEGRSEDLKGFIYDVVPSKGGVLYKSTTDELASYVGEKYKDIGSYVRTAIMTLKVPTITQPSPPASSGTTVDVVQQEIFKEKIRMYVKTEAAIDVAMKSLYDLVWGQCSESLRSRLRGSENYVAYSTNADSLALLKAIRSEMTGFKDKQYLPHALHSIMRDFYNLSQGKHRSNQEYYDEFNALVTSATESGATIGAHTSGVKEVLNETAADPSAPTPEEHDAAIDIATGRYLAIAFLLGADRVRYGTLVEEIENEFFRNRGESKVGTYPRTVAEAYDYLCSYKKDPKNLSRLLGQTLGKDGLSTGVAFVQNDGNSDSQECTFITNNNNNSNRKKTCRRCGADGHTSPDCNTSMEKVEAFRQSQQANQGVSQLNVHDVDWDGIIHEPDDVPNFSFLNKGSTTTDEPVECTVFRKDGTVESSYKTNVFSQSNGGIPKTWFLLDNQSTCDIVSNPMLVKNLRQVEGYMQLSTQAGSTTTNWMGDIPGYYRPVWFHQNGIANILAMVNMTAKYHVTYDSRSGDHPNVFVVHKGNGEVRLFRQSARGLFYLDTADPVNNNTVLVTTVENNKTKYTDRDYTRAKLARRIQSTIGRPELKDFLKYIDTFPNCPVTRQDAINAEDIFGRDHNALKGKTTRRKLDGIRANIENIPKEIMAQYRSITLCIDIMFVNKIPFFMSISRNVRFITCTVIPNRKGGTLIKTLKEIHGIYAKRGFKIDNILGDSEFECTRGAVNADIHSELNICGEDEHVPDIERCIRTVKERTRCTYNSLPFEHYPPKMVMEMVALNVFWLNAFPHRLGVSQTLSPRTIVTGLAVDYNKHCRVEYGQYVQTHETTDNSMNSRTVGAIALRPTGNQQGGYYFYSLMSGLRLHRTHWTELPMPAEVKDRVHALARRARAHQGLLFTDGHGNDLDADSDDESDSDYEPDGAHDDDDDDDDDGDDDTSSDGSMSSADGSEVNDDDSLDDNDALPMETAGVADENRNPEPQGNAGVNQNDNGNDDDNADVESTQSDNNDTLGEIQEYADELEAQMDDELAALDSDHHPTDNSAGNNSDDALDDEIDEACQDDARAQASADNDAPPDLIQPDDSDSEDESSDDEEDRPLSRLRPRRKPTYGHLKGRDSDGSLPTVARPNEFGHGRHQSHLILQNIIMTQYNLKQGIKKFGDKGKEAVMVELQQLYDRDVMAPVHKYDLTPDERKGALRYLMFLKEKRCGKIKGRGCADGRTQRDYMSKEDTASPTVATEALILSCLIDAIEGRDVATCDIPGAFMQSDMKGKVVMKLEGVMAEVIIKIDPKKYEKYTVKENGKDVVYVILTKALYGTLQAALLFWQNLSSQLQEWGFEINPYDFCVANKIIDGKQCTIVWHVDDLKISHVDGKAVTTILNLLDKRYGQEIVGGKRAPLTITRGKLHDYLGMTLDFTEEGAAKIDMTEYLRKVLEEMPENMDGTAKSPAAEYLFDVQEGVENLPEPVAEFFHKTVAKLLFLCKRGRPDIQTAIAFLCTRVRAPTKHDYNKLSRVIKYLRGTKDLVLRLSADNLNIVKWWVDASYGVHQDMKSHTGGVMSMGSGAVYSTSKKQKLNTKSSTEAELVGIDDVLPQALWTKYFLEAQGYGTSTILNQDNQSTIKLADNGKASSGKGTRHINIRYFFITDRIARKEVAIQYCPTKEMVADYFTKPLQGELFYKFRDQIMGLAPMDTIVGDHRSVLVDESKCADKGTTEQSMTEARASRARGRSWADVVKSETTNSKKAQNTKLKQLNKK